MAQAANTLTLMDLSSRMSNNELVMIIELLTQRNRILEDVPFVPSKNKTTDEFTIRTSLPRGRWVRINEGVIETKSGTDKVVETMGKLDAYSRPNADLVRLSGNPQLFRSQEDMAFIDGISQQCVGTLIYGNQALEETQFDGLASRVYSKAVRNVWSAGGSGSDLTSLWVVNWDPMSGVYCFYPPEMGDAGLKYRDLGEDTITESDGSEYQVFRTHFQVWWGMGIKDHRMIARYGDLEDTLGSQTIPAADSGFTSGVFNINTLIAALNQMWTTANASIYVNRNIMTQIDQAAVRKANVQYYQENVFGMPTNHIQGLPIKLVEQLIGTEDALPA